MYNVRLDDLVNVDPYVCKCTNECLFLFLLSSWVTNVSNLLWTEQKCIYRHNHYDSVIYSLSLFLSFCYSILFSDQSTQLLRFDRLMNVIKIKYHYLEGGKIRSDRITWQTADAKLIRLRIISTLSISSMDKSINSSWWISSKAIPTRKIISKP